MDKAEMEPYKPPTSSRYSAPTASSPFSSVPSQQMPSAFSSHHNSSSSSTRELPAAFSKSRERGSGTKEGEWSAFGKRAVSPSGTTKRQGGEPITPIKFVPKNSILAHIEAALGGEIEDQKPHHQEKWGQSALKRATTAEKEIALPPPEKTFEEQFPTLKVAAGPTKSAGAWGKQSMAEKMRQKLQEEEEEQKKKEFEAETRRKEAEKNKVHSFSAIATTAFVYESHQTFGDTLHYGDDDYGDGGYYDEADEY
jgi:hypothetical protein